MVAVLRVVCGRGCGELRLLLVFLFWLVLPFIFNMVVVLAVVLVFALFVVMLLRWL